MSQELTPALTPEEWASALRAGPYVADEFDAILWSNGVMIRSLGDEQPTAANQDRHALAALCLYQQPFGFTQDDVRLLKDFAAAHREWPNEKQIDFASKLESIATRIANLLPPKDSQAPPSP